MRRDPVMLTLYVIFLKLQTIVFSIVQFTATNVYNYSATPPASLKLKHPSFWGLLVYVFRKHYYSYCILILRTRNVSPPRFSCFVGFVLF